MQFDCASYKMKFSALKSCFVEEIECNFLQKYGAGTLLNWGIFNIL
ncbi:hypothetical protein SAMN05660206_102166 [Sphingobacterium wenxiniae]|uniref:Uncharacterized protein n=1 Tax=Sphingobacterium wenxiniae TaxID=683125 RepID=A0A1I6Q7B6_9SPHI|nr:hypothetical protein SAMN05660206_102166 [Sphingobacterium wenxiniae]